MKKIILLSAILATGVSATTYAKTIDIDFDAHNAISQNLHLEKDDVIMLHTTVPVGVGFMVEVKPTAMTEENISNFNFMSSVVGVEPARQGGFVDFIYAGANPGWVSYTFTGEQPTDVIFQVQ